MANYVMYSQDIQLPKNWTSGRPDGHAPISIMGDHMHGKGEWMFSYRYMYMDMNDLRRGNTDATRDDALATYMVAPVKMPMQMHMLGAMYAPGDRITLMMMLSYQQMTMDLITRMGGAFSTEASGFGDVKLTALYKFFNANRQMLHGQVGISIPTGSVSEKDVTPASSPNETILPYPMQVGSGTLDTHLALTYLGQAEMVSWGSQLSGIFRFGENDRHYRYGNQLSLNNWLALKAATWLSFSARAEGLLVGEINGTDPGLNPMMVSTADTRNSGGTYVNGGFGFNTYVPSGVLRNLRLGFEWTFPLLQDLNGIQLKTRKTVTAGMQYSF